MTANAGAAAASAWGGKVRNIDLIPRFRRNRSTNPGHLVAFLSGRPGVKVITYGR